MRNRPVDILDAKIQLITSLISELESEYPNLEQGADRLHFILSIYEQTLLRNKHRLQTEFEDLLLIKDALRESGSLLHDLGVNEPKMMAGWSHGIVPRNRAMALANMLSRIILEFSYGIGDLEDDYPELRAAFARERLSYSQAIQ